MSCDVVLKLKQDFVNNKLHHAHIFFGLKGIGKLDVAMKMAVYLILGKDIENIAGFVHPDLYVLKSEKIKVEDIREMISFVQKKPVLANNKAVIIDCLDVMNRNASNAILKILEEPPANTYFFITCHSYKNLLPTIRSRCSIIRMFAGDFDSFCQELCLKGLVCEDYEWLYKLTSGSLGMAVSLLENDLYKELRVVFEGMKSNSLEIGDLINILPSMQEKMVYDLKNNLEIIILKEKLSSGDDIASWFYYKDQADNLIRLNDVIHLDQDSLGFACLYDKLSLCYI